MKKILISIRPEWVAKILSGEKTIEVRKTAPKCKLPCEVFIYCTNGRDVIKPSKTNPKYRYIKSYSPKKGCVVAKFTLNDIENIYCETIGGFGYYSTKTFSNLKLQRYSCVGNEDMDKYLKGKNGYAWYIDDLVIFDKPKELREFEKQGSYLNPSVKCRNKGTSRCNKGMSLLNPHKWVGCEKARLTHAPQSWCYVEVEE